MNPEIVNGENRRTTPSLFRRDFSLLEGDLEILRAVQRHRFLRRDQLSLLVGRHPTRLHRRLIKLERAGYLKTIRLPQQKYIYGIGSPGLETLVEEGSIPVDTAEERIRNHELSELFLKHEMMIVDLHVRLNLTAQHGMSLVDWREGKELYDSVLVTDHKGSNRLPVRPDAFFTLLDSRRPEGANRANYLLEADRSTSTHARFEDKIRAYRAYIEQGRHEKKFGIKGFRVLTVTLTEARAKNLSTLASSALSERGWKYFLFVPLLKLIESGDPIGENICYCPRSAEDLRAILPPPNQLQKETPVV